MAILVVGGTGLVGSQIVSNLLDKGESVVVMTRSKEKAASAPANYKIVVGDLADPPSLLRVFEGIDKVMLITIVHPDETAHGLNGVKAAKKAGIRFISYLSVLMPPDSTHIPHFASKIPIENAIRESGIPFTILRPNNFFQNDYYFKDVMLQYGIYPQPIGATGVSRVDIRDVAEIGANALAENNAEGQTVNISGLDSLTGKSCAATWSKHLGTEINYMGDDLDKWAESASASMPSWMVYDFRIMYDYFQKRGFKSTPADNDNLKRLLRREPRSMDEFCSETARAWKEQSKPKS